MLEDPEFIMQVRGAVADVEKGVMGVLSNPIKAAEMLI